MEKKDIKKEPLIPSFKEIREKHNTSKEALSEYFKMAKEAAAKVMENRKKVSDEIKIK